MLNSIAAYVLHCPLVAKMYTVEYEQHSAHGMSMMSKLSDSLHSITLC